MELVYEPPALEYFGKVTAITSSIKCSPGADAGMVAKSAADGAEFEEFQARLADGDPGCVEATGGG